MTTPPTEPPQDHPTRGEIIGNQIRAEANKLTAEERAALPPLSALIGAEPPSREAVEAALALAEAGVGAETNEAFERLYDMFPDTTSAVSASLDILAAEVQRLTVDLGSAQDKLDQIEALCEGHSVGLRDYVLDVLKQP